MIYCGLACLAADLSGNYLGVMNTNAWHLKTESLLSAGNWCNSLAPERIHIAWNNVHFSTVVNYECVKVQRGIITICKEIIGLEFLLLHLVHATKWPHRQILEVEGKQNRPFIELLLWLILLTFHRHRQITFSGKEIGLKNLLPPVAFKVWFNVLNEWWQSLIGGEKQI